MKLNNLLGQKFGRLMVIERAPNGPKGTSKWVCKCDCDNVVTVYGGNLVRTNHTTSCGCAQRENSTRHGHTRHIGHSPTYDSWRNMKLRCFNPRSKYWHIYGGAGITVCERWNTSFENFLADMGARPHGKTLGRFLDLGNYELGNCAWLTPKEQGLDKMNKRALLKWAQAAG